MVSTCSNLEPRQPRSRPVDVHIARVKQQDVVLDLVSLFDDVRPDANQSWPCAGNALT
jgi:hypothetical protein